MRRFVIRLILFAAVLSPFFLLARPNVADETPTLHPFTTDRPSIQQAILENELSDAQVYSASGLRDWETSADFPDLCDRTIASAYAGHPATAQHDELDRRRQTIGEAGWAEAFDTGLLALTTERYRVAEVCFQEALTDPAGAANPFVKAYLGRARLKNANLEEASAHFTAAIEQATSIPKTRFALNFMFAMDLFASGNTISAFEDNGPIQECLQSDYPPERAFALYEQILRSWSNDDREDVENRLAELNEALGAASPVRDSSFEQRRIHQATELAERVPKALAGQVLEQMILDEECCDCYFTTDQYGRAADRLRPWVQSYSLQSYSTWDTAFKDQITWVYLNYLLSEAVSGNQNIAEPGLREFIRLVPEEDYPRRVIEAHLWLGFSLMKQEQYLDAAAAYEAGLEKDAADSLSATNGLRTDTLQSRILGGKIRYQTRSAFVRQFRRTLLSIKEGGE